MKATQILMHEHEVIGEGLRLLDAVAARLARGDSVAAADLERLLEFFAGFADGCHHAKEEGILFPALEAAGLPHDHGPVAVMLSEHEEGRRLIGTMRRNAAAAGRGDREAALRFADAAREYVQLLEAHIVKENGVLFPAADGMLTEANDREITAAFDRHEEREMGAGAHQRFHAMLDELAARYR